MRCHRESDGVRVSIGMDPLAGCDSASLSHESAPD